MHRPTILLGEYGEDRAVNFLINNGYSIVERNFRCKFGEIDIVAEKKGCLYIVEVKTRSSSRYGEPEEAVNRKKLASLYRLAELYSTLSTKKYNNIKIQVVAIKLVGEKIISCKIISVD